MPPRLIHKAYFLSTTHRLSSQRFGLVEKKRLVRQRLGRRLQSNESSSSSTTKSPGRDAPPSQRRPTHQQQQEAPPPLSFPEILATLGWRGLMAASWVYVLSEYCYDMTLCEGPSMDPTIQSSGEIILIDKWSPRLYGMADGHLKAERAAAARRRQKQYHQKEQPDSSRNVVFWHEPRISVADLPSWTTSDAWQQMHSPLSVGDVVVVNHPLRTGTVCKRVVGLPGDRIVVNAPRTKNLRLNHKNIVPDGHLWLEGDNPANSSDSRDYGAVPAGLVVGRVCGKVWPVPSWMPRGAPPRKGREGGPSTVLPAGYRGQPIRRGAEPVS